MTEVVTSTVFYTVGFIRSSIRADIKQFQNMIEINYCAWFGSVAEGVSSGIQPQSTD